LFCFANNYDNKNHITTFNQHNFVAICSYLSIQKMD
jgi:hypothetical protein